MRIKAFYDTRTSTLTYVVYDAASKDAVVIDPVLDYDPKASKAWTESADEVIAFLQDESLNLEFILETHAHADHLSGSQILKKAFPAAKLAVGARIVEVQALFKEVFDLPDAFATDGRQFDRLLADGEVFQAGLLDVEVIFTPGHTPADVTFKIGEAIFTGDALFMPDVGTGRCDFPGGSADDLYTSVHDILYALPDTTQVYVGHDYPAGRGRKVQWQASLGEQKQKNVALPASRSRENFVAWRNARDASLEAPRLLFQSVQVNVDAGALPEPSSNKRRYLKIPINVFRPDSDGDVELAEV